MLVEQGDGTAEDPATISVAFSKLGSFVSHHLGSTSTMHTGFSEGFSFFVSAYCPLGVQHSCRLSVKSYSFMAP